MILSRQQYWRYMMHRAFKSSLGCFALFFGCILFSLAPSAMAQADISGYWNLRVPNANGEGTLRNTYYGIQQTRETLAGSMLVRRPNVIPITGTFKDGAVHFVTVP